MHWRNLTSINFKRQNVYFFPLNMYCILLSFSRFPTDWCYGRKKDKNSNHLLVVLHWIKFTKVGAVTHPQRAMELFQRTAENVTDLINRAYNPKKGHLYYKHKINGNECFVSLKFEGSVPWFRLLVDDLSFRWPASTSAHSVWDLWWR